MIPRRTAADGGGSRPATTRVMSAPGRLSTRKTSSRLTQARSAGRPGWGREGVGAHRSPRDRPERQRAPSLAGGERLRDEPRRSAATRDREDPGETRADGDHGRGDAGRESSPSPVKPPGAQSGYVPEGPGVGKE